MRKPLFAIAIATLAVFAGCETLQTKASDQPQPQPQAQPKVEAPKLPQVSEGQLQEQYIARRNEGRKLLEAKKFGSALDAFLEANNIRPNSADIQLFIAEAYVGLEYFEKAKSYFDRYLTLEKDRNPDTYRAIAKIYGEQLELWDLSLKIWTKVIAATAGTPISTDFLSRGRVYQRLEKNQDAIEDFNKAAEIAKKNKDDKIYNEANAASAALASSK